MTKVKIYGTPTCPWCHVARQFFEENKIAFDYLDVSTDIEARTEMVGKSGQMGVPVIDVNGTIIVGFNQSAIKEALSSG